ncbi:MAG TPA: sulfotransferase domain-containing protein [Terriglobales bacterium]|nr:sulfotransferase domain-containing protein [Terriglobales bacterium]
MATLRQIRYQAAKSALRIPLVWLRHRGLEPRDMFVASYPRSGSTWLRFLLYEILTRHDAGFDDVNRYIPDVGLHGSAVPLLPNGGRLIKTHEAYRPDYKRALYIVRDVRDVALSEYAYQKAQGWIRCSFQEFLSAFVRGTVNGYGSWEGHVRGWLESPLAAAGDLLLVRYSDLRGNTKAGLSRITQFLGVNVDLKTIEQAIQHNNVQNMRKKEDRTPQIGYDPRTKSIAEDKRFVRSGGVGGWRERLTPAQAEILLQRAGRMLARLGFEDDGAPGASPVPRAVSSAD